MLLFLEQNVQCDIKTETEQRHVVKSAGVPSCRSEHRGYECGLGSHTVGFESRLHHLLAEQLGRCRCLSFLMCKITIMILSNSSPWHED